MKKLLLVLLLFILLVAGGLAFADSKVRELAEDRAEQKITAAVPEARGVHVTLDGWPFVFGVLVASEVKALHVAVDEVQQRGVRAHDLRLDVEAIAIDRDALLGDQRLVVTDIGSATVHVSMTDDEVSKAVKRTVRFGDDKVWVTVKGHEVPVRAGVRNHTVVLDSGIPGAPKLKVPLPGENVLPCEPELSAREGELDFSCTIDALPGPLRDAMAGR